MAHRSTARGMSTRRAGTSRSVLVFMQIVLLLMSAMGPALIRAEEAAVESAPPATSEPSAAESPAPSPEPTVEPSPEATPEATPEPTPEATPEATPETTPEPAPMAECSATGEELVWTGRDNYQAGETVGIRGSGYAADCEIVVSVERPDGVNESFAVATTTEGRLVLNYLLPPPPGVLGEYFIEVRGADAALLASTNFYDAPAPHFDIVPNYVAATGQHVLTALVRNVAVDAGDTARCIRVTTPAQWTVSSATFTAANPGVTGPWTLSQGTNFVQLRTSGPGIRGLANTADNWVRFEITATAASAGTNTWSAFMNSANVDCASGSSNTVTDSLALRVGGNVDRDYTADFRDSSNNVVAAPSVNTGTAADFRIRITRTAGGDDLSYAAIALPTCFTNITSISTTDSGAPSFTANLNDNVLRLTTGTKLAVNNEWVQVHFNATASCSAGTHAIKTAAWKNTSPETAEGDIFDGGVMPLLTVVAPTGSISGTVYNDANGSGTFTAGELPLAGATLSFFADTNGDGDYDPGTDLSAASNQVTTGTGTYSFNNVPAGTYFVLRANPTGFVSTGAVAGTGGTPTVVSNDQIKVVLPASTNSINNNFFAQERADLSVTKSDGFSSVTAGDGVPRVFTITISNAGPAAATGVTLTDTWPAGYARGTITPSQGSCSNVGAGPSFTCSLGTISSGGSATVQVGFSVPASTTGNQTNTASATSNVADPNTANNEASDTNTVNTQADIFVTKSDSPDPVTAGNYLVYTIVVENAGPSDAQSVSLADVLPSDLQNATYCTGAACDPSTGSAWSSPLSLGTLADEATTTVRIRAQVKPSTAAGVDAISNTATVSTTTSQGDNVGPDSATALTSVVTSADVSISKDDGDGNESAQGFVAAQALAGNNLSYSIIVSNAGPSDAQSVAWSDTLPSGTTFISLTPSTGCTTPAVGAAGTVSCTVGTLAPGGSASYTLVVKVAASVADGTVLSNTAAATTATSDPVAANNSDTEETNVEAEADLSVTKADSVDPVVAGTNLTYTLTITNGGPSDAQDANLSDTLPAGTTFVSLTQDSGTSFSCTTPAVGGTGSISCDLDPLAAGASASFSLVVAVASTIADGASLSNTASVSTSTTDPDALDNSDTETTDVAREADLSITKSDSADPVVAGTSLTYTVTVSNLGPSSSSGFSVSDTLPAGTTLDTFGGDDAADCAELAGVVTCTHTSDLAVGGSVVYTITVDVAADIVPGTGAELSNTATVDGDDDEPANAIVGNNSATETTDVIREADLSITKDGDLATVVAGTNLVYTITVTNGGPSNSSGFTVSDTLPADVTFVSFGGADAADCGHLAGVVTCTHAGDLAVGGSIVYTVTVTVDADIVPGLDPELSNTATVDPDDDEPAAADPLNNSATETTEVIREADLGLTKSDSPDPVKAGEKITYTLTVTNYGPSYSSGFAVEDTLSADVAFVALESSSACTLADADLDGFGGTVTCTQSTDVAPGAANAVSFTIVVLTKSSLAATDATVADDGILNSATVTGDDDEPDGSTNANLAETETDVIREADLGVDKYGPDGVLAGGEVPYAITIENFGPSDSDATTLTDVVPSPPLTNVKYCAFAPDETTTTCTATTPWPATNQLSIPAIPAGQTYVVNIVGTVPENANNQTMTNTASIPCAAIDPKCTNNTDTVVTVVTARPILLVIDEDSLDNGMRFSASPNMSIHDVGQDITSGTSTRFSSADVNDNVSSYSQRSVLSYFSANAGKYITVMTGQTGDEGWFAPNSAPASWGATGATLTQRLGNYFGLNGASNIPSQSKLDKVPDVRPLRAKGLHLLEGQTICAVVYDSDISANYGSRSPRISASLMGETLGVVAFTVDVNGVHRLKGFSSSTLPEVRIRIEDATETCQAFRLFVDAPAPSSSSVPNDVDPHVAPSAKSYPAP